jgi:Ser/Thr protein kinase RdoA (MazF antagonist)
MSIMPSPSDWPSSYIREMHAAVSTSREILASLAHRATGGELDQAERIVEGYENEVYRVETTRGDDVVIRIRRFGGARSLGGAIGEARAIERAREAGVPGPEVLLVDMVTIDGEDFPVMVQRAVPGRPLGQTWASLDADQRYAALVEVGEIIARLGQVPAPGDWAARTRAEVEERRAERNLVLAAGFTPTEFDEMFTALERYVDTFPCPDPVLCHGDLGPSHIYLDAAGRVSGVIDFGDAGSGSLVHDLAVLRARGPGLDIEPVLSGYHAPDNPLFRQQLDLDTLLVALFSLQIGVEEDDSACLARASSLIRKLLRDPWLSADDQHGGRQQLGT